MPKNDERRRLDKIPKPSKIEPKNAQKTSRFEILPPSPMHEPQQGGVLVV
jgi:hypothetical protein